MKTLKRLLRFIFLLISIAAFCAAVFFVALQTEKTRPIAQDVLARANLLRQSIASSQAFAENPSIRRATPMVGGVLQDNVGDVEESDAPQQTETNVESSDEVVPKQPPAITSVETIEVIPAETSTIARTFTGVMTPAQSSDLGFKRIERIAKLPVDQGDVVKKGDTLAVLDARSLLADKRVLLAELRAANARLAELEAGPRQQTIDAAQARLQELQSLVELATITSDRKSRLVEESASSQQQVDNARLQLAAAQSRHQSQLQVVRELKAGTRREQIEAQKAMIEKLEASIASLEITIDESTLKAPYDAVVSKRMADEGMTVAPGAMIVRLVQRSEPEAWIGLPTSVARELDQNDSFRIRIDDETQTAKLKSVLPELDAVTRTQTAVFVLDSSEGPPSFGQIVRLEWQQRKELSGFWLPTSALARSVRGLWSVFVVEQEPNEANGVLRHREVEVLRIETDRVLLRGTLEPGDRVVSGGVQKLVAGQTVKPKKVAGTLRVP